jgi:hypothetical protein
MKTIIRFFSMLALVGGIAVTGALAQNPCDDVDTPTAQYTTFTEQWTPIDATLKQSKPPAREGVQTAINTGKAFIEKWGNCEAWAQQSKFVTAQVKRFENVIVELGNYELGQRIDKAINSDNTAEIYTVGKEILAKNPNDASVQYVLSVAALREIAKNPPVNTYNADALRYAKQLLDQAKAGSLKYRKNDKGQDILGILKYTILPADVQSELLYTLGYINYYGQKDRKTALPYFYQATQAPGFRKEFAPIYAAIGANYIDEAAPIGAQIADLITKLRAATTDDEKMKLDAEIKQKEALFNGYTERAMDAFARAAKFAKADSPAGQQYKKGLEDEVKRLYKIRFEKDAGVEQWVATSTAKPLPDPTSPVQPVSDPEPTTTTTTTGAGTGVGAANGSGVGAANGKGVGAANGTGVGNAAAAKTATAKPAKP